MVAWPSELTVDAQKSEYQETFDVGYMTFEPDSGPPKRRRRFSRSTRMFTFWLFLTKAQVAILREFYETTCDIGTLKFDWTHPRTQEGFRFVFLQPPVISHLGGDYYKASLNLMAPERLTVWGTVDGDYIIDADYARILVE